MVVAGADSPREWSAADLGAFFVSNRTEFLAHAKRVTRTSAEAEEIVQDSLVRVLLACPDLESVDHARSYFHRVIENLSIDLYRLEARRPRLVVLDDATSEIEAQWSVDPDYSEQIAIADDAAIVREAISLLSASERAALVMWEFEGRSAAEIARELGIKESSVRHFLEPVLVYVESFQIGFSMRSEDSRPLISCLLPIARLRRRHKKAQRLPFHWFWSLQHS
jgi:RNA polymerase sigma factor (sigma-70 family)